MPPRTPLLHPDTYFGEHPDPMSPGLKVFGLYLIGAIVATIVLVLLVLSQTSTLASGTGERMFTAFVRSSLILVLINVAGLYLIAAIMHFWLVRGTTSGSFQGALAVAAWSHAPELIGLLVSTPYDAFVIRHRTFVGSDLEVLATQIETMNFGIVSEYIVPVLAVMWGVYILAWGIGETHDVSRVETLPPAIFIGIVLILLTLL